MFIVTDASRTCVSNYATKKNPFSRLETVTANRMHLKRKLIGQSSMRNDMFCEVIRLKLGKDLASLHRLKKHRRTLQHYFQFGNMNL